MCVHACVHMRACRKDSFFVYNFIFHTACCCADVYMFIERGTESVINPYSRCCWGFPKIPWSVFVCTLCTWERDCTCVFVCVCDTNLSACLVH